MITQIEKLIDNKYYVIYNNTDKAYKECTTDELFFSGYVI